MLLSIKINNKNVVLNDDFSFSMTRENPIFNDPETLSGDYIESLTFPMKGNRDIFMNMNRITSNIKDVEFSISIFYNNYHLISGTFTVTQATEQSITGDAKLNALSFFNRIKDLKLTDIPDTEVFKLGNNENEVKTQINNISYYSPTEFPFRFPPMKNEDFYDENDFFEYNGIINEFDTSIFPLGNHIFHNYNTETINTHPFVPCFFLEYLIKTLIKEQQYTITLPQHPIFQKLILATNKGMDKQNIADISILTQSRTNTDPEGATNSWNLLSHIAIIDGVNMLQSPTTFIIKETGQYNIYFNFWIYSGNNKFSPHKYEVHQKNLKLAKNNDHTNLINIKNNSILFFTEGDILEFYGEHAYSGTVLPFLLGNIKMNIIDESILPLYSSNIFTNKHVPKTEQITLFTLIKGLFNAGFYVDEMKRTVETVTFNEIIAKTPIPLDIKISEKWSIDKRKKGFELKYENSYPESEHPEEINYEELTFLKLQQIANQGDYAKIINEANIYFYDEDEEGWTHFNIWNQERKIEEDDIVSFDIPVELPKMIQIHEDNPQYLMAEIEGKGESFLNKKTETNDFTILIWHGMNLISNDYSAYSQGPLASIAKYNGIGTDLSTVPKQPTSLLIEDIEKNFYQSFTHFLRTARELSFTTKMKIADFMKLRLQEKYTAGGYVFIIKSLKMSVTVNNYSLVDMVIAVI